MINDDVMMALQVEDERFCDMCNGFRESPPDGIDLPDIQWRFCEHHYRKAVYWLSIFEVTDGPEARP